MPAAGPGTHRTVTGDLLHRNPQGRSVACSVPFRGDAAYEANALVAMINACLITGSKLRKWSRLSYDHRQKGQHARVSYPTDANNRRYRIDPARVIVVERVS